MSRSRLCIGALVAAVLTLTGCQQGAPEARLPDDADAVSATAGGGSGDAAGGKGGAVGGPGDDRDAAEETSEPADVTGGATDGAVSSLTDEQVRSTVAALDAALGAGDVEAYLDHVAPDLAESQRAWFQAVQDVPMEMRQLRLDGVVSRNAPGGTVAHVGLRHQISGVDDEPVLEQYRWVLAERDGKVQLVQTEGRNGDYFGYPQIWDAGAPVAVLEAPSVVVLVTEDYRDEAESVLPTLDLAAEIALAELGGTAFGPDRIGVQLIEAETMDQHAPDLGYASMLTHLVRSPDPIAPDAPRLSGREVRVAPRLLLDRELTSLDLTDFGESPGGQTSLRYVAAYAAMFGDDPDLWSSSWAVEGFPQWYSAAQDEPYLDYLRLTIADHHAASGPPALIPTAYPMDDEAYLQFSLEAVSLSMYLAEAVGADALRALSLRLAELDVREDADAIAQAYVEVTGMDQAELLEAWAAWSDDLAESGDPDSGRLEGR